MGYGIDLNEFGKLQKFYNEHLFDNVLKFWMNSDLIDDKYGGYITSVDQKGASYNTDKSVWFQGRGVWTFSALCNRYGKRSEWLDAAKSGRDFLERYCIDADKRMFFTVTRDGRPLRKRRYFFSESFYIIAMAEYSMATGDKSSMEKAAKCFEMILDISRNSEHDPYKITPKTYTSTRSERSAAVPMVLLSSAQILRRCMPERADYYSSVIRQIVDELVLYHYKEDMKCVLETVGTNGEFIDTPAGRTINPGHSCENAWFLMNEAIYSKDDELLRKALNILDWALERGWDDDFGGLMYFVDANGRPCEQLEWDMKLWWVHNEALIATLMAYGLTGDEKYYLWFKKIHEYSFAHFPDAEYGEWYGYLHRDGTVSHTQKGSLWKGPYHLPRCLMVCDQLLGALAEGKPIPMVL